MDLVLVEGVGLVSVLEHDLVRQRFLHHCKCPQSISLRDAEAQRLEKGSFLR
jgi:hypothetical protein